jgi:hypothetical protein
LAGAPSIFPSFSEKEKPNIKHSFDIWHGAKNLGKKIVKVFLDCTLFYILLKATIYCKGRYSTVFV